MDFTKYNNTHENTLLEYQEFCQRINTKQSKYLTKEEQRLYSNIIERIELTFRQKIKFQELTRKISLYPKNIKEKYGYIITNGKCNE